MGIFIAIAVILLWLGHLLYLLFFVQPDFASPLFYIHILIQGYLYPGLFITAHDAMHGSVSPNHRLNDFIGHLATTLFAFLSYREHHESPHNPSVETV